MRGRLVVTDGPRGVVSFTSIAAQMTYLADFEFGKITVYSLHVTGIVIARAVTVQGSRCRKHAHFGCCHSGF